MKHRVLALGLALCLVMGLAACGGGNGGDVQPTPDPVESVSPAPEGTLEPTDAPAVPDKGTPAPSDQATATPESSDAPEETPSPTPTPIVIGDPTAPPSAEPSDEPTKDLTAVGLRDMFMLSSSQSDAPTADFSNMADYLENFYNLSKDDLADFVFYMPDISTALQEFFLAKAKDGKVDTVKAACQSRLQGLKEEAEFYPGTADFVDTAKVEVVGDWVVLAVCPEADRMAKILQDAVK